MSHKAEQIVLVSAMSHSEQFTKGEMMYPLDVAIKNVIHAFKKQ